MSQVELTESARWAGPVKEVWRVARLRHVARIFAGGTPDKSQSRFWEEGTIPWLNSGAVNDWLISEPTTYLSEDGFRSSAAKWIPAGSLVLALAGQGKTKGKVARIATPMTCNQSMAALVPSGWVDSRYLQWWLHANYAAIRGLAGGDLRDGLNLQLVGDIPVPLPAADCQRAIADFLDAEITRIDALVARKRRMTQVLLDRERSCIERKLVGASTTHVPLRRLLAGLPQYGAAEAGALGESDWPRYIRITDLTDGGELRESGVRRLPPDVSDPYLLSDGDLLIARSGATVGKSLLYRQSMGPAAFAGYLIRFRPDRDVIMPELLEAWTRTKHYWSQVALASLQATIENISADKYKDFRVPYVARAQQLGLVQELASVRAAIRECLSTLERQIGLLEEHRQSLITAAVIGELEVPGVAA